MSWLLLGALEACGRASYRLLEVCWEPFGALLCHFWGASGCSGGSLAGPLGSLGVLWVTLGAQGWPLGASWVALGSPCCRRGRLLVALWCREGSPEAQQYKKKPRFPFYVLTGLEFVVFREFLSFGVFFGHFFGG